MERKYMERKRERKRRRIVKRQLCALVVTSANKCLHYLWQYCIWVALCQAVDHIYVYVCATPIY